MQIYDRKMPLERFYLTKNISNVGKELAESLTNPGWQREMALVLLEETDGREKSVAIQKILSSIPSLNSSPPSSSAATHLTPGLSRQMEETQQQLVHEYIQMLPRAFKNKAKILVAHLLRNLIDIDDDGVIIYRDNGEKGGYLIDIIRYYCSPSSSRIAPPTDLRRLQQLLLKSGAPASAFGSGKNPAQIADNQNAVSTSSNDPSVWSIPPDWRMKTLL